MSTHHTDPAIALDHVMFYGGFEMDTLCGFFERAGFFLTPLGRHNHGTVNRLAMLEDQYIEMIGFLPGTPKDVRPEIQAMPLGLNGLAAKDRLVDRRYAQPDHFTRPMRLERPIDTPQASGVATFTITHVVDPVDDARAFLCGHHTPELLWVKEWMRHANTAKSIAEVCIPTRHEARLRRSVEAVFDRPPTCDGEPIHVRDSMVHIVSASRRGRLVVRVRDLDEAARVLSGSALDHTVRGTEMTVPLPELYRADLVLRQR